MYLVFDAGGSSTKYGWMTADGEIIEKGKFKTPIENSDTVDKFLKLIVDVYQTYKEKGNVEGIAFSLPGQIDVENGIVYGGGAIRYMDRVHFGKLLSDACDGVKVALENDGKCAALAEVWRGNASDVDDACVMIIGTGIGGAIIKDRKVHRGKNMLAGELSYMFDGMQRKDLAVMDDFGDMDSDELGKIWDNYYFSTCSRGTSGAMCHRVAVKKGLGDDEVNGEKVYAWANAGDEIAINELEDLYFHIATICMNLFVTFDPEVILIGGGISAEPAFVEGIRKYVELLKKASKVFTKCKIDICKFQNDSNLLGALFNYMQLYGDK